LTENGGGISSNVQGAMGVKMSGVLWDILEGLKARAGEPVPGWGASPWMGVKAATIILEPQRSLRQEDEATERPA